MNIVVLGGDGFCGWPTALKLAANDHSVMIYDNLSRRQIDVDLKSSSLTKIATLEERCSVAREHGMNIGHRIVDVRNYYQLLNALIDDEPEVIVHFAEQRAAPYSMLGQEERRYTVDNNISGTHNVLSAMVDIDKDIHLVHLGTMGVYGYSKDFGSIPEGYLNVKINSTEKDVDILYPTNPGSVYHMTKSLDQILFQFYNKNWKLKITDLHQGIVWGAQTQETSMHPKLVNRFDYDGIYGTVLNRFIIQAAADLPMSVYGTGGQTRAFIHIQDTARCVQLAAENPPEDTSKVRIFNQVAETQNVLELAQLLEKRYGAKIEYLENPRKELAENELEVSNAGLRSLGFEPITLDEALIEDVRFVAAEGRDEINQKNVNNSPKW